MWRIASPGAVVLAVAALAPTPVADAALFMTPSRNISCATGENNGGATGVTCTVFSESTSKGQKNWSMHATGRVRVFFLQANASAEAPILRYGRIPGVRHPLHLADERPAMHQPVWAWFHVEPPAAAYFLTDPTAPRQLTPELVALDGDQRSWARRAACHSPARCARSERARGPTKHGETTRD